MAVAAGLGLTMYHHKFHRFRKTLKPVIHALFTFRIEILTGRLLHRITLKHVMFVSPTSLPQSLEIALKGNARLWGLEA